MFYNIIVRGYGIGYVLRKMVAERPSKDRRRIAEGPLTFGLKISDLQFCMIHTRNALVFRGYVIAT